MKNLFTDLETYCPTPITDGTHKYAEKAEITLWPYVLDDGQVRVWDVMNGELHTAVPGGWSVRRASQMPDDLRTYLGDTDTLVWFQNGGNFDFVVIKHAMPAIDALISKNRRRDTMVQAYAHSMPGSLDKLGEVLGIDEDKRKHTEGRKLVLLFCKPRPDGSRASKATHPAEWQRFIEYAAGDVVTMREAHRRLPMWNYTGKQVALWHADCEINNRGFLVDRDLAEGAVRAVSREKDSLGRQVQDATDGAVQAATQRDELLRYILAEHGVDLPDMRADTLERRLADPDLPDAVKELIAIRLQASRNASAKFVTLLKGVSSDGRLRGTAQFRGAGRTGRWAHRMFQPGNMMRPDMPYPQIELAIEALKADCADLLFTDIMRTVGNTVRGAIIAPPDRKLVIADLSNIEGRVAAWLAGEDWKLEAFRQFDAGVGADLYIRSYASSFNVPVENVPPKGSERQIGKVCLAKGSLVLTHCGWLPIERVTAEHKLWDGVEWIPHKGLLSQGIKSTISLAAVRLTPDHCVLSGIQWKEAGALAQERSYLLRALESGAARLPSRAISSALWAGLRSCSLVAIAGALSTAWRRTTSVVAEAPGAPRAASMPSRKGAGGNMLTLCLKQNTESGYFNDWRLPVFDARHPTTPGGRTTGAGGFESAICGSLTAQLFSPTFARCRDGMTRIWKWTARTLTAITSRGMFSSSPNGRTCSTAARFLNFKPKWIGCEKKTPTFDLACAGPRKRFTVMSARGPLIVHNCELMFQYGGGVGAWMTGAATYGIDLDKMTDQVWDVLPAGAKDEARDFLDWMYQQAADKVVKSREKRGLVTTDETTRVEITAACIKARFGLSERTFIACDAIKRLWRAAHPEISSYWKELESKVAQAIDEPGVTLTARRLKIRRDGAWLRIGLPSGRALCYPNPKIEKDGTFTYTGFDNYRKVWGRVSSYGGKTFENAVQAVACDQFAEPLLAIESAGYATVILVHDEVVAETPDSDEYTPERLSEIMCMDLRWNTGLPLAAKGFSAYRYKKDD